MLALTRAIASFAVVSSFAIASAGAARQLPPASNGTAPRATDGIPAATGPRCAPETLDLGEMTPGEPKTVPFTVKNTGTEAFVVESVKGGCGCTTVSAPPKGPIAPGESFTVQVTVDPGKKGGIDLVKPLYVTYADGRVEQAQIKGRVKAAPSAAPSVILFRLPAASGDVAARGQAETRQSEVIQEIDRGLPAQGLSPEFRMRLHREAGMLFVHGSDADLDAVRDAVRRLPASMEIRESRAVPGT